MDPWGYETGRPLNSNNVKLVSAGDYIATVMGWITNVASGGATNFPNPFTETLLYPTKGAVAFWINLSRSHRVDYRNMHGGCPVIEGQKWILNKWIHSFDQWKIWPCALMDNNTNEDLNLSTEWMNT